VSAYRTHVLHLPARGWLTERWVVEHVCTTCRQRVAADHLIEHARTHDAPGERLEHTRAPRE
jgi:hypothetical protein